MLLGLGGVDHDFVARCAMEYDATLHQGYDEICFANYDVISWQKR